MQRIIKLFVAAVIVVVLLVLMGRFWAARSAPAASTLGVVGGKLPPCPDSPNCVSSQTADAEHQVDGIPFVGDAAAAQARMRQVLAEMPRTRIVVDEPGYLRAEFRTLIFDYVDDGEFYFDTAAGVIQVRSASRLGYSDLGANRARIETIRTAFVSQ